MSVVPGGFKMTPCAICGEMVSRPKSFSLEKLGGKGRACRKHPEVIALVEQVEKAKTDLDLVEKAAWNFDLIMSVEAVRMLEATRGFPRALAFANLERARGKKFVDQVRAEVERLGPVTLDEVVAAVLTAVEFERRAAEIAPSSSGAGKT